MFTLWRSSCIHTLEEYIYRVSIDDDRKLMLSLLLIFTIQSNYAANDSNRDTLTYHRPFDSCHRSSWSKLPLESAPVGSPFAGELWWSVFRCLVQCPSLCTCLRHRVYVCTERWVVDRCPHHQCVWLLSKRSTRTTIALQKFLYIQPFLALVVVGYQQTRSDLDDTSQMDDW